MSPSGFNPSLCRFSPFHIVLCDCVQGYVACWNFTLRKGLTVVSSCNLSCSNYWPYIVCIIIRIMLKYPYYYDEQILHGILLVHCTCQNLYWLTDGWTTGYTFHGDAGRVFAEFFGGDNPFAGTLVFLAHAFVNQKQNWPKYGTLCQFWKFFSELWNINAEVISLIWFLFQNCSIPMIQK